MSREILKIAIGLNDLEIKAYFILLNVGPQPASIIAAKIDCPRSSVYPILERMLRKGVITYFVRRRVRFYSAVGLDKIEDLLKEKESHYSNKARMISNNRQKLKDFFAVYKVEQSQEFKSPKVQTLLGIDGLKTIWKEFLAQKGDIYFYGWPFTNNEELKNWVTLINSLPAGRKVKLMLPGDCQPPEQIMSEINESNFESVYVNFDRIWENKSASCVCGSLSAFISYEDELLYAIKANDSRLASQLLNLFAGLWRKFRSEPGQTDNLPKV